MTTVEKVAGLVDLSKDQEQLVSRLVGRGDIAKRCGVSLSAVKQWIDVRHSDTFPLPLTRINDYTPVWDWYDVEEWLYQTGRRKMRKSHRRKD